MLQAERIPPFGGRNRYCRICSGSEEKRKAKVMVTNWVYYGYTSVKEHGAENPTWVHLWKCPSCGCVTTGDATKPDMSCPVCKRDEQYEIDQCGRADR